MWNWSIRLFSIIALAVLLSGSASATNQGGETDSGGVTFDFSDIDIRSFIKVVSELTGRNYVVDPSVSGKITVTSPSPIPRAAVASVFQSVLNVYGYAAVGDGDIVKIVPAIRAKQEGGPIAGKHRIDSGVETRIIRLQSVNGQELRSLIQPLLTRAGNVALHTGTNTVILTDVSRNVQRLASIIRALDSSGPEYTFRTFSLDFARADDLAEVFNTLFSSEKIVDNHHPVFVADARSNRIIASIPADLTPQLEQLIRELDVKLPETRANIRVYHLNYSDAETLASVLNTQLVQTPSRTAGKDGRNSPGGVPISADKPTNSLIITASPEQHRVISEVIHALDVPRPQILVQGLIVELSGDLTRELGLEWRLTDKIAEDKFRVIGGTNLPGDGSGSALQQASENPYAFPPGLALGLVKGTISFGGHEFANIGALARAMETTSGVNILSTPVILALDNVEAEIIVGEERPFLKGSQTTDTGTVIRTYEFKDIGLTLKITPRITENNKIQMKIFQEIKNFVAESDVGAVTSTKRQARTTVRVPDGQMVVIGGLLKEDRMDRSTLVPCLGHIPGLGHLFRTDRKSGNKTNLLIFITPHIIRDADELDKVTKEFKDKINRKPDVVIPIGN